MSHYVDGYVLPVAKRNLRTYRKMAQRAGKIWREHGALDYKECVGDDLKNRNGLVPFSKMIKIKSSETVVFSYIVFKSRAHRDRVNAMVMKDPRMTGMNPTEMPFDVKRIVYGGFKVLVEV